MSDSPNSWENYTEKSEMVEFTNVLVDTWTAAGLKCVVDGVTVWLPQSKLGPRTTLTEVGSTGTLEIPRRLAEDRGLV